MADEFNQLDDEDSSNPNLKKICDEQQAACELVPAAWKTYVIVMAVNKDANLNLLTKISCQKGKPFGGYVYDFKHDCYHYDCADYLHIGFIPISFCLKMRGVPDWQQAVPVADTILKKYLTNSQKKELRNFKSQFDPNQFEIQFIQMIASNE